MGVWGLEFRVFRGFKAEGFWSSGPRVFLEGA